MKWLVDWLNALLRAAMAGPEPRTYDGNPSAGAEPSPAEREYEEAENGAKGPNVIKHTWRF